MFNFRPESKSIYYGLGRALYRTDCPPWVKMYLPLFDNGASIGETEVISVFRHRMGPVLKTNHILNGLL